MGSGNYDSDARTLRADASGYATAHASDARVFVQAAEKRINQGMDPSQITVRECRDNNDHPATFPVVLALDVTGSMGQIPVQLIKNDLPRLMTELIKIHPDISLCFMAVGDHEWDRAPLQVGQFEASDEMLDHWLTRTWIESGGGPNMGESYALPWMFAANKIVTDAWDKRGQKGLLITVGDEPILPSYRDKVTRIFGAESVATMAGFQSFSKEELFERASERWEVHHIAMRPVDQSWTFLGDNFHQVPRGPHISQWVADIVRHYIGSTQGPSATGEVQIDVTTHDSPNPPQTIPTPL